MKHDSYSNYLFTIHKVVDKSENNIHFSFMKNKTVQSGDMFNSCHWRLRTTPGGQVSCDSCFI